MLLTKEIVEVSNISREEALAIVEVLVLAGEDKQNDVTRELINGFQVAYPVVEEVEQTYPTEEDSNLI